MAKLSQFRNHLVACCICAAPIASFAQIGIGIGISVHVAPPPLPVYAQPPCPTAGFLWTPGYWGYSAVSSYYWVPGVWIAPPHPGLLWTPGYWGLAGGAYGFHAGYWGAHVGFYGGVNYGFGFGGVGFTGGAWAGNTFRYNTAVASVNTAVIHNTYVNRTVVSDTGFSHASFNGPGGMAAQPSPQDRMAMNEQHFQPTANQFSHQQNASQDHSQWASSNGGHPTTTAMNSVNQSRFNQQGRIAQGVGSGQLNARETGRLENQEARTNQEVHTDRQANGGRLTQPERQQVKQQQRTTSQHIYNQKHDAQHAPR
jgi:hypothetical protein